MENRKVWLVGEGEYSDARVIAVFDNERDAEVHAAMVDDDCYVWSMEIGKLQYDRNKDVGYRIEMCYVKNEFRWRRVNGYFAYKVGRGRPRLNCVTVNDYGPNGACYYSVNVVANSKDKAYKIASDLIAKFRAEQASL